MSITATPETLNGLIEFDSPFRVNEDGTITTPLPNVHSPSATFVELEDRDPDVHPHGSNEVEIEDYEWFAWGTYTQQYASAGSHIMHASEYLGGGIARELLAEPGVYAVTSVEVDDDPEHPAGWIVLKRSKEAMARFWVCTDCLFMMANGETGDDEATEIHSAKMDAYAAEHPDPPGSHTTLGDRQIEFATHLWCGGCGSGLAGTFHEAFLFTDREED